MPHRPYWFKEIRTIRATFEAYTRPFLSRRDVEKVLQISNTEAKSLVKKAGGRVVGNSLVVERQHFLDWLDVVERGEDCQHELLRREKLEVDLEKTRSMLKARQVRIQTGPLIDSIAGLNPNTRLGPGKLEITFFGTEDLLRQLMELGQAVMNDYVRFQEICEG